MKVFLALLAVAAVAALPVAALGAADPTQTPCGDVPIKDASGDQLLFPTVIGGLTATASKGPDNTDIRNVYFNSRDGVTTANLSITNLTKDFPPESRPNNGVQWAVWFDVGDLTRYVKAISDGTAITYKFGGYTIEETFVLGEMGDTTGTFTEGPNGIISIVVPAELGVKAGTKLDAVSGRVAFKRKDADNSYTADRAPDAAADDKTLTVPGCPAAASDAPPPAPPAVQPQPQPQPQPAQPQPQPQPAAPARVATGMQFTVKPGRDARPPFAFRTIGKLTPPPSVNRKDACQGRVSVQVKSGKKTVSVRRVSVRPDCTFVQKLKIANRKRLGKARSLRYVVTFQGNKVLLPQKAKARTVRVR